MNLRSLHRFLLRRALPLALLVFGPAAAFAQSPGDPPARAASLSLVEGSVVFAPAGETQWRDAVINRPVTRGDRLWTDQGARAELHLGSAALHLDGQTFVDVVDLDDDTLQASLNEGTVNARVRRIESGENFEVDTPQLAFRASRPGDYRIDVDPAQGTTRVTVRSGAALVYGASAQAQELVGGQVVTFAGRDLERVNVQTWPVNDEFDRWAAERNRAEDRSIAARHVPLDVVGYQQLDSYGNWAEDVSYGTVWYPRVTVADWAPYRYGHWEFIAPWGWTWIDDAAWGFAPFHYGRWAVIGSRWAWVPGRIGPRPVYAPALVVFVGGNGGISVNLSFGSGIGWFPLAPGEAWRPTYRASTVYLANVNRYSVRNHRYPDTYTHQHRSGAWTAVRAEDFSRGRPVQRHWQPVNPADAGAVRITAAPALPEPRRFDSDRAPRLRVSPPAQLSAAPMAVPPRPRIQVPSPGQYPAPSRREAGESQRPVAVPRPQETPRPQDVARPQAPDPRWQQQRAATDQQAQERVMREQQVRAQRDQQAAQERALRQQQAQERAQRQQQQAQEQTMRHQQQAQEQAQRRQQHADEQVQRQQGQQPQGVQRPASPPQAQQETPRHDGRGRGKQEPREDSRSSGGDEGGRGRGQGRGG